MFWWSTAWRIRMDNQRAVLQAAAAACVTSIAPQQNVQRLLPNRPGSEMERFLPVSIHHQQQAMKQKRMNGILFIIYPEEIVQSRSRQAGQYWYGILQKEG